MGESAKRFVLAKKQGRMEEQVAAQVLMLKLVQSQVSLATFDLLVRRFWQLLASAAPGQVRARMH